MKRKFHFFLAGMDAAAGLAGTGAWGLGTADGAPDDASSPAVMLGEEDMAEQLEIERNRLVYKQAGLAGDFNK